MKNNPKKLSRRQVIAAYTTGVSGMLSGCTSKIKSSEVNRPKNSTKQSGPVGKIINFGNAAPSVSVQTFQVDNNNLYFATVHGLPAYVGSLDLSNGRIQNYHKIPTGDGAWATGMLNNKMYLGTHRPADLYSYNTKSGALKSITRLTNDSYIWTLDINNKNIFAGTSPTGMIYKYDTESNTCVNIGTPVPSQDYVRSLRVTDDRIYAGIGAEAHLISIDRETGEKVNILPEELKKDSFAYDLELNNGMIVVRTIPSGTIAVINRFDPSTYNIVEQTKDKWAGPPTVSDTDLYFTASSSSALTDPFTLYKHDMKKETTIAIAELPYKVDMKVKNNTIYGVDSTGVVWTYRSGGPSQNINLLHAGMPAHSSAIYSMIDFHGNAVIGGHRELFIHDSPDLDPEIISVPGQPKAMEAVDKTLYLALYQKARLAKYNIMEDETEIVARIQNKQNRPKTLHYYPKGNSLFIGTAPRYGTLGGAISKFNISTGNLYVDRNIVMNQSINTITSINDTIFLGTDIRGGHGVDPVAEKPVVAAWDPNDRVKKWQIVPDKNKKKRYKV